MRGAAVAVRDRVRERRDAREAGVGVKLTLAPVKVTEPPLAGWVTAVMTSVSPVSGTVESLASTLSTVAALSLATRKLSLLAVGVSFTGVTFTGTVAVSVPPLPSGTV